MKIPARWQCFLDPLLAIKILRQTSMVKFTKVHVPNSEAIKIFKDIEGVPAGYVDPVEFYGFSCAVPGTQKFTVYNKSVDGQMSRSYVMSGDSPAQEDGSEQVGEFWAFAQDGDDLDALCNYRYPADKPQKTNLIVYKDDGSVKSWGTHPLQCVEGENIFSGWTYQQKAFVYPTTDAAVKGLERARQQAKLCLLIIAVLWLIAVILVVSSWAKLTSAGRVIALIGLIPGLPLGPVAAILAALCLRRRGRK